MTEADLVGDNSFSRNLLYHISRWSPQVGCYEWPATVHTP